MSAEVEIARANVEDELVAARALANRRGWTLWWDPEHLRIHLAFFHPRTGRLLELRGTFDMYKTWPPAWVFVAPNSEERVAQAFPLAGDASIFHSNLVICAPWNRLAYAGNGGPHSDWPLESWLTNAAGSSQARTIADMVSSVDYHLRRSPGMTD